MTLYQLSFYDTAFNQKRESIDEMLYMMGCYNFRAFSTALHNFALGFNSKTVKPPMDYLDKPFLCKEPMKKDLDDMTDEELDAEIRKAIEIEQQYMNRSTLPPTKIAEHGGRV